MGLLWIRWKRDLTWTVIVSLLATGLVLSCARGGGNKSSEPASTSETTSGTGTVVITGRIL